MKILTSITSPALALFALAGFALSPRVQAVDPPPDGGYPNQNTAEGEDALLSLTTGPANTAMGFDAPESNTTWSDNALASGIWTVTGRLHVPRSSHTATLLQNGMVLVASGFPGETYPGHWATAELYDPASGTWTFTGKLNRPRFSHTATLLQNGMVLVAGGTTSNYKLTAKAELYDPASGTWTETDSLNTARSSHTATLLQNGMVLVAGGVSHQGMAASAQLYDPTRGSWTATGGLSTGRAFHTATLLQNGMVLVAGGKDTPSAELYDPASGTWTATDNLNTARYAHTATLLPNGKVLVAGGYHGRYLASTELYDPASGTWTATGPLNTERSSHTATLLENGVVLVAGGTGMTCCLTLTSAELGNVPR